MLGQTGLPLKVMTEEGVVGTSGDNTASMVRKQDRNRLTDIENKTYGYQRKGEERQINWGLADISY